eukprot:3812424-Prymnesium_polylepis.1
MCPSALKCRRLLACAKYGDAPVPNPEHHVERELPDHERLVERINVVSEVRESNGADLLDLAVLEIDADDGSPRPAQQQTRVRFGAVNSLRTIRTIYDLLFCIHPPQFKGISAYASNLVHGEVQALRGKDVVDRGQKEVDDEEEEILEEASKGETFPLELQHDFKRA